MTRSRGKKMEQTKENCQYDTWSKQHWVVTLNRVGRTHFIQEVAFQQNIQVEWEKGKEKDAHHHQLLEKCRSKVQ